MKKEFTTIYNNLYKSEWAGTVSRSGQGSGIKATKALRHELPKLLSKYNIKSIFDAGCGDFYWMKKVELSKITYIGADVVDELIAVNSKLYPQFEFISKDISVDTIPAVDLIIARDVLGHLSFSDILKVLENFKKSKSKYLLTTTFTKERSWDTLDIKNGKWRTINLMGQYFYFDPILLINEGCTESDGEFLDKSMALFEIDKLDLTALSQEAP